MALGITSFHRGEMASARAHLEQGIALYDPQQHRFLAFLYGQDPGVTCLLYASHALWLLGYHDQALKRNHEALSLARELSHPHSLAFALAFAAYLHNFRREWQLTQERAETVLALATEQGFVLWAAMAAIIQGWALAEQGQAEEGIAQMRQGLATYRAIGTELGLPHRLALLAEGYRHAGQADEGLRVLAEALAVVDKNAESYAEAELHRLKGELLRERAVPDEHQAEACFHQALDVARRQQARSLELRAVMSLSRLWQQQGKRTEARALLAPLYGWFTEGFDTADLQEARALLEALA
jgi:predicted ATPase